jgi:hypothetical protein
VALAEEVMTKMLVARELVVKEMMEVMEHEQVALLEEVAVGHLPWELTELLVLEVQVVQERPLRFQVHPSLVQAEAEAEVMEPQEREELVAVVMPLRTVMVLLVVLELLIRVVVAVVVVIAVLLVVRLVELVVLALL